MGCISWLHLSDWHQGGVDFDRTVLRDTLLADIESRSRIDPSLQSIDFVVFSGDASNRGTKAELEATRDQLFAPLLAALNLPPDRLFLVPGNHDMDRGAHDLLPSGLRSPLTTDTDVQKWLGDSNRRERVLEPFQAYTAFVTEYTGQPDPAYASVNRWTLGGRSVALLGLNSAWMCARNMVGNRVDDHGHLVIGEPQIHAALAAIAGDDLRIVVMHHAFEWLAEFDRARVESRLKSAADIILWGHEHRPQVREEKGTDGHCLIVPAGAAFDGRVANNPRYTNAYNFAVLDLETRRGFVHLRRWNEGKTCWVEDADIGKGGRFPFSLPKQPSKTPRKKPKTASTRPKGVAGQASPTDDAGAGRGTGGSHAHNTVAIRSPTREQRLERMREEIADVLAKSPSAMSALETVFDLASANPGGVIPPNERAARLRDHFWTGLPFDDVVNGLTRALEHVRKNHRNDPSARQAIVQTSLWLLPWLHIVSDAVDCGPWENKSIGTVLPLPAGLKCFAEIVMAGIDLRKPKFDQVKNPLDFPCSAFAAEAKQPEQGFEQDTLDAIRHDLMMRLGVPSETFRLSMAKKDESIRKRINFFMTKKGTRIFVSCGNHDDESTILFEKIAATYPELGVLMLAGDPVRDQELFDNIRHLLGFEDTAP